MLKYIARKQVVYSLLYYSLLIFCIEQLTTAI